MKRPGAPAPGLDAVDRLIERIQVVIVADNASGRLGSEARHYLRIVRRLELAAAGAEIAELQRVLGKKTLENENLPEAVEYAAEKMALRADPCWPGYGE